MLNSWDGNLKIDEEENAILASRVAAGVKNDDNTFSGVTIGDWNFGENNVQTGIYGFHHGAMSYGFKEDGTAFIGKDDKGRIVFEGDTGKIYSSNWIVKEEDYDSSIGMLLDLDDGIIRMRQSSDSVTDTEFSEIVLTNSTYKTNTYYYLEKYILSTSTNEQTSKEYYKPMSYKQVALTSSSYKTNRYYIKVTNKETSDVVWDGNNNGSFTEITSIEYKLSTEGFNSEEVYYYPGYFSRIYFTSSEPYKPNKYYYLNTEGTPKKDDKGYYDPSV